VRTSARRTMAAAWLAIALLVGCTGTFTPALPTVVVVVRDAVPGETRPSVLALVALDLTPTGRSLRVIEGAAYTFTTDTFVIALDATPRGRDATDAWLLTRPDDEADPARTLYRFDLSEVRDEAGVTLPLVGAPRPLVDAAGAWVADLDTETAAPPGCLTQLVVGGPPTAPDRYVALWDDCGGLGDPLVHVVDLQDDEVTSLLSEPAPLHPFGIRAGVVDPASFTLGTIQIGGDVTLETRPFVSPLFDVDPSATVPAEVDLLDVAVTDGAWWSLVAPVSGGPSLWRIVPGDVVTERPAPAGANRVVAARSPGTLLLTPNRAQVVFPDTSSPEVSITPLGATIEANDYAVVARAGGGLCVLDAQVPALSGSCEFTLSPDQLTGARLLTWTYAAP
jgi:hypothetical protein